MQGSNRNDLGMNLRLGNSDFHGNVGDVNSRNVNLQVSCTVSGDVNVNSGYPDRRKEIAEWVSPLDFSSLQEQALEKRTPGTLEWLVASPVFRNWKSQRGPFLWCPGPPGAGKTVFAAFVIDLLQKAYYEDPSSVSAVCYIYCEYSKKLSVLQLFEVLLKQLILSCPLVEIDKIQKMKDQNRRLPLDEIISILQFNFSRLAGTFVVVDALDECFSESDRHHLLQKMRAFSDVNTLITSRDLPSIRETMRGVSTLNVHATDRDVKIYLSAQRERSPFLVNTMAQAQISSADLDAKVIAKAGGVFLLATEHGRYLSERINVNDFKRALDTLPTDAAASHASAIGRINQQSEPDKRLAYSVLSLVSYAFRPFKSIELRHAAANVELDKAAEDDDLADEERIVSVCAGLITVNQFSMEAGFIHYTAQEYLQEIRQTSDFLSEADITKSFMRLIRSPGMVARPPNHPLIQYTASSWAHHLRQCGDNEAVIEMALSLLSDSEHAEVLCSHWDPHWDIRYRRRHSGVHAMHIVAAFGLTQIGKLFIQQYPQCMDQQDCKGRTPLSWAAGEGYLDTVLMLLEAGNVRTPPIGLAPSNLAPMESLNAFDRPVRHKVQVNQKDIWGRTPLSYAAKNRHLEVVKVLLDTGQVEIDVTDRNGRTPLSYATGKGDLEVMKMLLNTGKVEVDVKREGGRTPLSYAAENGNLEIVKMLLDAGKAEIDVKDEEGRAPLSYAAKNGHLEIVKMLLDTGKVDIDALDWWGLSPLGYAVGYRDVVKLLEDYRRSHPSQSKLRNIYTPNVNYFSVI